MLPSKTTGKLAAGEPGKPPTAADTIDGGDKPHLGTLMVSEPDGSVRPAEPGEQPLGYVGGGFGVPIVETPAGALRAAAPGETPDALDKVADPTDMPNVNAWAFAHVLCRALGMTASILTRGRLLILGADDTSAVVIYRDGTTKTLRQ